MTTQAFVIIAGCGSDVGRALADALGGDPNLRVECAESLEAARDSIDTLAPAAVVVCPPVDQVEGIALAMLLQRRDSDSVAILVADELDASMLRAALKAGVHDVFTPEDGVETIAAAVLEASEAVMRHRTPAAEKAPAAPIARAGKVVTVFSTKGGVGKSVLSTNLAAALAHDLGRKTILLDLDLEFGDVAVMLQLPPDRTIFDAVQAFDRLDPQMLDGFLVHHSSGLSALLAPVRPEEAESVTISRIGQIIEMLSAMADFVVIDTPASLSDVVLTALEHSDVVLAVATLDIPSVKNTRVSLQKLHQLGLDGGVQLVLNRADSKVWLEPHEIEKAMADRIVARIPSDRIVPRSVNRGVPVVLDAPRSAVARSILALAREVAAS
jgi:pilus assembly protein CpaE